MQKINIKNVSEVNLLQELTYKDVCFLIGCAKRKAQSTIKKIKQKYNLNNKRINLYHLLVFQGIIQPIEAL